LAILDAAVGIALVVDGVRSASAGSRHVGAALLLCAAMLGSLPWLTEAPAVPPMVYFGRV
jgi:hypothetical protein